MTGWMGENHVAPVPTAGYGVVTLGAAVAYLLLQSEIIAEEGPGSRLAQAVGRDVKGKVSPALYAAGIGLAFVSAWIAVALYVAVAFIWLVPDPRIEKRGG